MRFESATKPLPKRAVKYCRISKCVAACRQAVVERKAIQVLILKRDKELAERDQQMQELQRQLGKTKGPKGKSTPLKATAIEEAEADSPHSRSASSSML